MSEWSEADQARRGEPVRHHPRQRVLDDERMATSSSRSGCRPPRRVTRSPRTSSAATAWWIYERVAQGMAATQKSGVLELSFVTDQAMTGVSRKTPP